MSFSLDSGTIDFRIQIATIRIKLSIICFKGTKADYPYKCVLHSLNIAFIITNSADAGEMHQTMQRVYSTLSDEINKVMYSSCLQPQGL